MEKFIRIGYKVKEFNTFTMKYAKPKGELK